MHLVLSNCVLFVVESFATDLKLDPEVRVRVSIQHELFGCPRPLGRGQPVSNFVQNYLMGV